MKEWKGWVGGVGVEFWRDDLCWVGLGWVGWWVGWSCDCGKVFWSYYLVIFFLFGCINVFGGILF